MSKKKVVVIGGGTGTYQVLVGLKKYPTIDLSAIVTMADSGGSTGRLREEFGMFPPGDIRRALLALSSLPIREKTLRRLFDFRFKNGKELRGHSLGNIFLAALTQITGSPERAIEEAGRILNVSGSVLPVTLKDTHLYAILKDGTKIMGETNIDIREEKPEVPIQSVFLKPTPKVYSAAEEAILNADLIVLGPGDLYTSIIPNLLVRGVTSALAKSRGYLVFIINLMTKYGETNGFTARRFVDEIKHYLGPAAQKLKYVVINEEVGRGKSVSWYRKHKAEPVKDDLPDGKAGLKGVVEFKVLRGDFSDKGNSTIHFIRHDPNKLARALIKLLE